MAKKKSNAGQPTVMTEKTLRLLQEAFEWGCTDREACLHAQIAQSTLYSYQLVNKEYVEWKEAWKDRPTIMARKSVVGALPKDPELSLKYLERKKKDEFSTKSESDVNLKGETFVDMIKNAQKNIHTNEINT